MVFIRRVRTASGATAVQVVEYRQGRQRIVEHVGSAHTEAELGVLLALAAERLEPAGQAVFDLGLKPTPLPKPLVSGPRRWTLLPPPSPPWPGERVAAGRVVSTGSGLLYQALAGVFEDLGFAEATNEAFRDLVIARIVEPTSILDVGRVLTDLGRRAPSEKTLRRTLERCAAGKWREQIAAACFTHALTSGDVSLCLYDVTTLYFEAEKEDDLRKVGYSKERRSTPRSWSGSWSTGTGSRWRSAASRATPPRPPRSCRS